MTERIDIVVQERGATTVRRSIDDIGTSGERAAKNMRRLQQAIGLIGGIALITGLRSTADAFTTLNNSVRVAVGATGDVAGSLEELRRIALVTSQPVAEISTLFQRATLAAQDLGASNEEVFEFVESVALSLQTQGSSAQEAAGALLQLSQAIGGTRIQAEEFNSLIDGAPALLRAAAAEIDGTGGSVGRLRDLVRQGEIGSRQFFEAIIRARGALAEQAELVNTTVSSAFQNLTTQLQFLIGGFDQSVGASASVAQAILIIADNLEIVARGASAAAIAVGVTFATQAIPFAIAQVGKLGLAIAANPIGAFATAMLAATSVVISFGDQLQFTAESSANLLDFLQAAFTGFANNISNALTFVRNLFGDFNSDLGQFDFGVFLNAFAGALDALIGLFAGTTSAIIGLFDTLPAAIGDAVISGLNFAIRNIDGFVDNIISALNRIPGVAVEAIDIPQLENQFAGGLENVGAAAIGGFARGFSQSTLVRDALANTIDEADRIARNRENAPQQIVPPATELPTLPPPPGSAGGRTQDVDLLQQEIRFLEREAQALAVVGDERQRLISLVQTQDRIGRNLTESERQQVESLVQRNLELARQANLLDEIAGPERELLQRREALDELFRQGRIGFQDYNEEVRALTTSLTQLDNSFSGGIQNGIARVAEQFNSLGEGVSNIVVGAFDQATNAIVNFAKTGELSVRQLFASIAEQLLQLATQQLFAQLLGGLGGGNIFGALPGFATGGSFRVGGAGGPDSQLVAFRASPGERVSVATPQQQQRGMSSEPPQARPTQVQIINSIDPRESLSALETADGSETIVNVISRNRRQIRQILG